MVLGAILLIILSTNGSHGDLMLSKFINSKVINYCSYGVIVVAVTILGARSFFIPIFNSVYDCSSIDPRLEVVLLYIFSFSFTLFSFGIGALGISICSILPKFSKIGDPSLTSEVKEHVILSIFVFTGFILILSLKLLI